MASYSAGDLEGCLVAKLRADERAGGNHRIFEIYDDAGNFVASVPFSRSWRRTTTLGANMVNAIKRQVLLQQHAKEFDALVDCPLSREDYLRLVGAVVQTM